MDEAIRKATMDEAIKKAKIADESADAALEYHDWGKDVILTCYDEEIISHAGSAHLLGALSEDRFLRVVVSVADVDERGARGFWARLTAENSRRCYNAEVRVHPQSSNFAADPLVYALLKRIDQLHLIAGQQHTSLGDKNKRIVGLLKDLRFVRSQRDKLAGHNDGLRGRLKVRRESREAHWQAMNDKVAAESVRGPTQHDVCERLGFPQ